MMVLKHLKIDSPDLNKNLPVHLDADSDKLERELILKQLLYLRQDVNELKHILCNNGLGDNKGVDPSNPALFLPTSNNNNSPKISEKDINDATISGLKEDSIGEMTMEEYEREIIDKYLKKFKNNRRKTAKALRISERTLYRKLKEYDIYLLILYRATSAS